MAGKNLHVTVITPARAVFDAEAASVVAPAFDGELGVLPSHAPLLSLLGTGELRVTAADGSVKRMAVRGGFLQVNQNKVSVLTPESVPAEDIKADALTAEAAKLSGEHPLKADERELLNQRWAWLRARQKLAGAPVSKPAAAAH